MTIAVNTICTSIASLSVPGVKIFDLDKIPPDCSRMTPCMFPEPLNFITNFVTTRDSFGTSVLANKTVEYDLTYTFCYVPIGDGRTGLERYSPMVAKLQLILDKIIDNDDLTGSTDIQPQGTVDFGPVPDPMGNQYLGCRLVLHVIEYE